MTASARLSHGLPRPGGHLDIVTAPNEIAGLIIALATWAHRPEPAT